MGAVEVRAEIPAPPTGVWEVLADHRAMTRWAGVKEVVLREQGQPAPNGVGAIRVLRKSGVVIEEEITGFEPPARLAYRQPPGAIFRAYEGEVRLEPSPVGTALTWRAHFEPRVPGTGPLLRWAVQRTLRDMADRLAKYPFPL
jgi:uncharacterized protein YndB with AHSA1/START domain